jgi:hypothetical protein
MGRPRRHWGGPAWALEAALFPVDVVHAGCAVVIGEAGPGAQATVLGFCFVAVDDAD